jgi:excisionase family DNA binding protein
VAIAAIDEKKEFKLLSEREAAVRCGISRITLLRIRKAGRIGFYRIGTRVLFSQVQLEEFLASVEEGKRSRKVS